MKNNTDNIFVVGSRHKVNQDYVLTNERNQEGIIGEPFVVVSDGCSTVPKTDFGSRLLAAAAAAVQGFNLKEFNESYRAGLRTIHEASAYCRTIGLPVECLSATLLTAHLREGVVYTNIFGDGALAIAEDTGALTIYEYSFLSGAPYYPRYELDPADKKLYFDTFGYDYFVRKTTITQIMEETEIEIRKLDPDNPCFGAVHNASRIKFVALMSDGVFSFQRRVKTPTSSTIEKVPTIEVIKELLAFKNFGGEFVQRRAQRAFEKFQKDGWENTDDVSLGVLALCEKE